MADPVGFPALDPDVLRGLARSAYVYRTQGMGGVRAHTDYQDRPLEWITEVLGVGRETLVWSENEGYETHEWDGTPDPLVRLLEAVRDGEDVGVEAGTGTQKTFTCACLALWFLACFEDSLVVTVAPKKDQLYEHMWKEIRRLWPRFSRHFPDAENLSGKVRMRPGDETWAATAFVAGVGADEVSATKAQGWHAEHMLIITEETPGIHPAMMTALENTRTSPHNLQVSIGNPDRSDDELHRWCEREHVTAIRISALDHPNVVTGDPSIVPGAVSKEAAERRKQLYRNMPALYKSRIRGISPEQAAGVVLRNFGSDNLQHWPQDTLQRVVRDQGWPVWSAIDSGHWRTAFLVGVVDRGGRLHIVEERFWHREPEQDVRARQIHEVLSTYDAKPSRRIITDLATPFDVQELNDRLRAVDSPYRARPVAQSSKARQASVTRLNWLLGETRLLFRRELGEGQTWRLGLSTSSQGEPMEGSRLLWEMKHWRYPDPRTDQAQQQDPDDDTADGADAIAALRYLVMGLWKAADYELPEPEPSRNRDTVDGEDALSRRLRRIEREKKGAYSPWGLLS